MRLVNKGSADVDSIAWAEHGRKYRRDGAGDGNCGATLMHPERHTGEHWRPGALAAEVEAALTRHPIPEHVRCVRAQRHETNCSTEIGFTALAPTAPTAPAPTMTLTEAARAVGISPAAMLKRARRHGLAAAIAMGGRLSSRWANRAKTKAGTC